MLFGCVGGRTVVQHDSNRAGRISPIGLACDPWISILTFVASLDGVADLLDAFDPLDVCVVGQLVVVVVGRLASAGWPVDVADQIDAVAHPVAGVADQPVAVEFVVAAGQFVDVVDLPGDVEILVVVAVGQPVSAVGQIAVVDPLAVVVDPIGAVDRRVGVAVPVVGDVDRTGVSADRPVVSADQPVVFADQPVVVFADPIAAGVDLPAAVVDRPVVVVAD